MNIHDTHHRQQQKNRSEKSINPLGTAVSGGNKLNSERLLNRRAKIVETSSRCYKRKKKIVYF